jgi:hypothetical protein
MSRWPSVAVIDHLKVVDPPLRPDRLRREVIEAHAIALFTPLRGFAIAPAGPQRHKSSTSLHLAVTQITTRERAGRGRR